MSEDIILICDKCTLQTIKTICIDINLPRTGTKQKLIESISNYQSSLPELLNEIKLKTIQNICSDLKISNKGTKNILIEKIVNISQTSKTNMVSAGKKSTEKKISNKSDSKKSDSKKCKQHIVEDDSNRILLNGIIDTAYIIGKKILE